MNLIEYSSDIRYNINISLIHNNDLQSIFPGKLCSKIFVCGHFKKYFFLIMFHIL